MRRLTNSESIGHTCSKQRSLKWFHWPCVPGSELVKHSAPGLWQYYYYFPKILCLQGQVLYFTTFKFYSIVHAWVIVTAWSSSPVSRTEQPLCRIRFTPPPHRFSPLSECMILNVYARVIFFTSDLFLAWIYNNEIFITYTPMEL